MLALVQISEVSLRRRPVPRLPPIGRRQDVLSIQGGLAPQPVRPFRRAGSRHLVSTRSKCLEIPSVARQIFDGLQ